MKLINKEKAAQKLKLNVFNIKSLLVFNRKKVEKVKNEKKKFSLLQIKKKKVEEKEKKIESPSTIGSTLKNIGQSLLAKPKSIIDKFKELFGIILLGILVNNLPKIIKGLQDTLVKIKEFFDNNPWIGKTIKFVFGIIAKGMMGILDLTKALMPVIGGSFKFALDTIRTAGKEIGKAITLFDQLGAGINSVMNAFGYKPPAKAAQAYAKSKGKYYSSTTGKTYKNYKTALQNSAVKKGAQQQQQAIQQRAQKAQAGTSAAIKYGYHPNKGTTGIGTKQRGFKPMVVAPLTTGYGANRKTEYLFKDPNNKNSTPLRLNANDPGLQPAIQRYQAVNQAQKVQKLSIGGTIRNFFGGMFGSRKGLGNIPPQEGTGKGGPSDIRMATKDSGQSYASPYASPTGTAKGRKARETVNYFKFFENNVKNEERNLVGEEKNLSLFDEFMKSYKKTSKLREKYGSKRGLPPRTPPGGGGGGGGGGAPSDEAISVNPDEVIGKVGTTGGGNLTGPHIHIEDYSSPGAPIPTGVKSSVLVEGKPMTSGVMTSGIGMRWGSPHNGEDWDKGWENKPITLTGGLKFVKYVPMGTDATFDGYGNVVVVQSPNGKKYFLAHLNAGPSNLKALQERQRLQLQQKTPGGSNEEKIWNYFRSHGLSEIAVSGIMGNASVESTFRSTAESPDGEFKGVFQWATTNANGNRWAKLVKWAKSKKLNPEDIDTQLQFAWIEMTDNNSPYFDGGAKSANSAYNKLISGEAKTPEQAAEIWRANFERGSGDAPGRKKEAARLYKKWKGNKPEKAQPVLSPAQKLEKDITKVMINKLGTRKIDDVSGKTIEVVGDNGNEKLRITSGGIVVPFLGRTGGSSVILSNPELQKILDELNKLPSPSHTNVKPVTQNGPDVGNGVDNSASITVIDRTTVAVMPKVIEKPIPIETPVFIPIEVSSSNFNVAREIIS